jgi:hypothetical protein
MLSPCGECGGAMGIPGPDAEANQHPNGCNHKEHSTPQNIHEKRGKSNCNKERPDLQAAIYYRLIMGRPDTHGVQYRVQIIRNEPIPGTLREK